ncbi:beta strand repeat-containing protein [Parasediminibacterium paludis]|uniref:Beta strand repeat-containing protein n=1 Tax=Parasediminibacterium paludis TaxID=908966 RepID=A0ABV8PYX5_9BACT
MLTKKLTLTLVVLLAIVTISSAQSKIYWLVNSGNGTVNSAFQDGTSSKTLVSGASSPDGSCISTGLGKIYWVEGGSRKLRRANFDGSAVVDLADLSSLNPRGITIDEASNKLYIIGTSGFGYCNLDGTNLVVHLNGTQNYGQRGIAYNPYTNKLYITDQSSSLKSVDTSGANLKTLFSNLSGAWGVKIDVPGQKIYFSDYTKVDRCNLDGSGDTTIISIKNNYNFVSLCVDGRNNKLFWFAKDTIYSSALDGSSQTAILTGLSNVFDMSVLGGSSVQSYNINFSNITQTTASAIWNKGNGTGRAVFLTASNTGTPVPQNGTSYTANAAFGSGSQIGTSGWYCVYNGTDSVVNITGLTAGTTYRMMVNEYSGTGANQSYNVSVSTLNPNNFTTVAAPAGPPTITSFAPILGKPGDVITITGTNFSTTPANNIVFFGATRAAVTAATTTSLTVTVPKGATYAPITELNTDVSLACYSLSNFNPIFSPAKSGITTADFSPKQDFAGGIDTRSVAVGDLDGDGKPDLVVANYSANTISVYFNTATSGSIKAGSFAGKIDFATGTNPISVAIGDLDGDGKPDLAVGNNGSNTISIFRNTSTAGSIDANSFAAAVNIPANNYLYSLAIGDLDGDGKLDLVSANIGNPSVVSVLRNTSTTGSLSASSFASPVSFTTGSYPYSVAIADLDGDGKLDLAVANNNASTVSILRNTSTVGNIDATSFATKVDFAVGVRPWSIKIGDLDGDGKPDLAVVNETSNTVSVFRNTSTSGSINSTSFASKVDFVTGSTLPFSVAIGDLDGDGKPDLAVANTNGNTVSILRNTATLGSISASSFAPKVDFQTATAQDIAIADIDGDGKPDLVLANYGNSISGVSVLRNAELATLNVTSTLTTFTTCVGTASASQSFTVSGTALTANLVVTAPTGFEVSLTSGSGYASSVSLTPSSNTVANATIYVRLTSIATGTPIGNIAITSIGATTQNIAVSGTANIPPVAPTAVTATPSTIVIGNNSNLNATSFGNDINWWTAASNGTLLTTTSSGINYSVAPTTTTTYYAEAQQVNNFSDNAVHKIKLTSHGGDETIGYSFTPSSTITVTGVRRYSGSKISIWDNSGNLLLSQPCSGTDGVWTDIPITPIVLNAGTTYKIGAFVAASDPIYASYNVLPLNRSFGTTDTIGLAVSGDAIPKFNDGNAFWFVDIIIGAANCPSTTRTPVVVTVNLSTINTSGTVSGLSTCAGTASAAQNFTVSGTGLTDNLVVTAPVGYEISLTSGSGYASSVTLTPSSNAVANTTIYVRLTATASGTPVGNITVTSTGATTQSVPVNGIVNSLPTPTITAGGATTFCAGGSVTLTASSGSSYLWSTGETTASINVSTSGSYTVTVTNTNGCSATSSATTVTVNPLPTPTITTGGATTFCAGGSVTLTASSGSSYLWSTGATTASINVSNSGNYSVTVTNSNGCSAISSPTMVTVNLLPVVAPITGANAVCVGSTITLNSNTTNGVWSSSSITLATINGGTGLLTGVAAGTPTITYTITDINGCVNSVNAPITVNALPILTPITGASSVCQLNTIALSNTTNGGVWSSANAAIATVNNTGVVSGITAGVVTISYRITNANNCSSTNTKSITVLSQPARTPIVKDTLICKATNFIVDATVSGTATYAWTASAGGFTSTLPKVSISNPALYRLTITLANGCFYNDSINIRNTTDTAIRAKLLVSAQGFINDNIVAVNLTSPTPQTALWVIPSGAQVVSQSTSDLILKFSNTGKYQIGLNTTSLNVCNSSDSGIVIISNKDSAVNNVSNNITIREVNVGPNPSTGIYNFMIKLNQPGKISIRIYRTNGIMTYNTIIPASVGVTNINQLIDITSAPKDTYVAVVQSDDSYEVRTLIKN